MDFETSVRQHESELVERVIPLIHDTFESYDDQTAHVLQSFFAAYSMAVRFAIARNTRKLLTEGESEASSSSSFTHKIPVYPDLPPETRLQEFGLGHVLDQEVFDKIVIGCSEAEQLTDNLEILRNHGLKPPAREGNN